MSTATIEPRPGKPLRAPASWVTLREGQGLATRQEAPTEEQPTPRAEFVGARCDGIAGRSGLNGRAFLFRPCTRTMPSSRALLPRSRSSGVQVAR